ncbi:saccharopine dehydrogenase family protein [Filimonas effusa]|uniref:Saccharopine dehydrogenase n=1 Tax=Filimonas effusa TaxID=2508721 RepID=A0A4Q1D5F3_9BACT|nr:saccharopine dehydrogenase NADP-binding domain-containing protein [Filimonas effusa]RXK83073.1 saccharopine dehydrogenase [Filimonas effusa]
MQQYSFLLYGANGYTGELIARQAANLGLKPLLAGRNKTAVTRLADELNMPYRIFGLNDTKALHAALAETTLVIHAAGPYHITALPMVKACIETGTHYIDLNGDISVFELIRSFHDNALQKDIMLLPGAGFDVVPTDCLAMSLKKKLPDATYLQIAFTITGSSLSRGTAISTLHQLGKPGARRFNGLLQHEPVGKRRFNFTFPGFSKPFFTMSIPWGDLSTAYYSTGIPNIETYTGISKIAWYFLKAQKAFNWLLRSNLAHKLILGIIKQLPAGPGTQTRQKGASLIYARVENIKGETVNARLRCSEAYAFTTDAALLIAEKITASNYKPGYQTPASAYGVELLDSLPAQYL